MGWWNCLEQRFGIFVAAVAPNHWVIHDKSDGQWWLVPAMGDGWEKRTAYHGHKTGLEQTSAMFAIGIGLPMPEAVPA